MYVGHFVLEAIVVLLIAAAMAAGEKVVEVEITSGRLLGVEREIAGLGYQSYLGIPYAESPMGAQRFLPPIKKAPWSGIRTATRSGPLCPHTSHISSTAGNPQFAGPEDCLTLDVYIPTSVNPQPGNTNQTNSTVGDSTTNRGWAVIVIMFSSDPETEVGGVILSTHGDLVVVVVKHRVGVLGYLSTGSEDAPGNLGVLDQVLALSWVQENIDILGGDRSRVTVYGGHQSHVTLHLYARDTAPDERLFQRLITNNAATTPRFVSRDPPVAATHDLSSLLGCSTANNSHLIECLRAKTVHELLNASVALEDDRDRYPLPWAPYLNEDLFTSDLSSAYTLGSGVDIVTGFSTKQCEDKVTFSCKRPETLVMYDEGTSTSLSVYQRMLARFLGAFAPELCNTSLINTLVQQQYADWTFEMAGQNQTSFTSIINNLSEIVGDLSILLPGFDFLSNINLDTSRPNMYFFDFEQNVCSNKTILKDVMVTYLLGLPLQNSSRTKFSDEERQLSTTIMSLMSNFITTGDPNEHRQGTTLVWPLYAVNKRQHLLFKAGNISIHHDFKADDVAFWTVTVPQVEQFLRHSCQNTTSTPAISSSRSTSTEYDSTTFMNTAELCSPASNDTDSNFACLNGTTESMKTTTSLTTTARDIPTALSNTTESTGTPSAEYCPLICKKTQPTGLYNQTSCSNTTTKSSSVVVIDRARLRWELKPAQASTLLKILFALTVLFALLVIILAVVVARTRSALRQCLSNSRPKRGIAMKKSIRGSSTTWLWKARDPDEHLENYNVSASEDGAIHLDFETKT